MSEVVDDLRLHPDRLAVGSRAGPETRALELLAQPAIVAAVARRIELPIEHLSALVHVELGDEMETAELVRIREGRQEELGGRRRIVLLTAATGPGPNAGAPTGAGARPGTTARPRTRSLRTLGAGTSARAEARRGG